MNSKCHKNSVFLIVAVMLASCAKPPSPNPPPPLPPVPKSCVKDACISLYRSSGVQTNVCKTDTDPNNQGIFVDIHRYADLREPVTFIYQRIQTDENGTQVGTPTTESITLTSAESSKWLFCTVTRDASNRKLINWLSRLCATNRGNAATVNCETYDSREKWPPGDRWNPRFVASRVSGARNDKALNCPAVCAQTGGLCRTIHTKDAVAWTKYSDGIDALSNPSVFPFAISSLSRLLDINLANLGRDDPLKLVDGYLEQVGSQAQLHLEGNVNGTVTAIKLTLPNLLRAKYVVTNGVLQLDFDDASAQARIEFSDSSMTSIYGGQLRATWLSKDGWLFATDKRCVAVAK